MATTLIALPEVLALLAALCLGSALVLTQFGLRHATPRQGARISVPTSAVLFAALAPLCLHLHDYDSKAIAIFAVVGLLLGGVTLLTFESNRRMGPNATGAFGNLAPLFATLTAMTLLGELPHLIQIGGMAAVVFGVVLLSADRRWLDMRWSAWSLLLPLSAAALRGFSQPLTKLGLGLWDSPFVAVFVGYTGSSLVVVSAAALGARQGGAGRSSAGVPWFVLVGIANGCAMLAMFAALAKGSVTLVSALVATYPVVTLGLTAIFLHEAKISPATVVGIVATACGVGALLVR